MSLLKVHILFKDQQEVANQAQDKADCTDPPAHGSLRLPGPARLRGVKAGVGTEPPVSLDMVCPAVLSATPAAAGNASAADTWCTPVTYIMLSNMSHTSHRDIALT